jgi:CRP/FNR family transcriptional regulator
MTISMPIPFHAIPTLASLRPDDLRALEPLCIIRGFEKGATVFTEGEAADRIHFIYLGRVKIVKSVGDRDVILELLGPGEPIGAVAAYERRPYPATAITIEPSSILSIPEHDFFRLLESNPEITRRLLAGLTMRLMNLNKRLADMTGSIEQRAARVFLTLADRLGEQRGHGTFIALALSRQEIADMLGTTIESAIRLMSRWQKESLLLTERDGFVIPDRKLLQELSASRV